MTGLGVDVEVRLDREGAPGSCTMRKKHRASARSIMNGRRLSSTPRATRNTPSHGLHLKPLAKHTLVTKHAFRSEKRRRALPYLRPCGRSLEASRNVSLGVDGRCSLESHSRCGTYSNLGEVKDGRAEGGSEQNPASSLQAEETVMSHTVGPLPRRTRRQSKQTVNLFPRVGSKQAW